MICKESGVVDMSNKKRRRAIKSKSPKTMKVKQNVQLLKQARKNATLVNARLSALNRKGFKSGTWSSKKLIDRLSTKKLNVMTNNRIKLRSNMTRTQLLTVNKSMENFLRSETSTPTGIENVRKKTIESLRNTLQEYDTSEISYEDAEELYEMLGTEDFEYFRREQLLEASDIWVFIEDATEMNQSKKDFINTMVNYSQNPNDADIRERASRLYEKYIL